MLNFQDIQLSDAFVNTNGESLGDIVLRRRKIAIASSSVASVNGSTGQAGTLDINASKSVEVNGIGSTVLAETKPARNLTINTDRLVVRDGAEVNVSSEGAGNAGNLEVTASSIRLHNAGKLTATSTSGEGGNIKLNDLDLLLLRGNSEISTSAGGAGNGSNGGNIDIDADLLIGLNNSDMTANAFKGEGSVIEITTKGIFGLKVSEELTENSDTTAFSEKDTALNAVIEINRLDIDPSADIVILPAEPVDISGLIAQGCSTGNVADSLSEFVITGRGGLPPTPKEATRSDFAIADLGTPVQSKENRATAASSKSSNTLSAPLVEAQGWVIGSKGEVILTTQASTVTIDVPWLKPTSCNAS